MSDLHLHRFNDRRISETLAAKNESAFEEVARKVRSELDTVVDALKVPALEELAAEYAVMLKDSRIVPIYAMIQGTSFCNMRLFFNEAESREYDLDGYTVEEIRRQASGIPRAVENIRRFQHEVADRYGEELLHQLQCRCDKVIDELTHSSYYIRLAADLMNTSLADLQMFENVAINAEFFSNEKITPQAVLLIDQLVSFHHATTKDPGKKRSDPRLARYNDFAVIYRQGKASEQGGIKIHALVRDAISDYRNLSEAEVEFCRRYPTVGTPFVHPLSTISAMYDMCELYGHDGRKFLDSLQSFVGPGKVMQPYWLRHLIDCFDPKKFKDGEVDIKLLREIGKRRYFHLLLTLKIAAERGLVPTEPGFLDVLSEVKDSPSKLSSALTYGHTAIMNGYWSEFVKILRNCPANAIEAFGPAIVTALKKKDSARLAVMEDLSENHKLYTAVPNIGLVLEMVMDPKNDGDIQNLLPLRGQDLAQATTALYRKKQKVPAAVRIPVRLPGDEKERNSPGENITPSLPRRIPGELASLISGHEKQRAILSLADQLYQTLGERFLEVNQIGPHAALTIMEHVIDASPRNPFGMALMMFKDEGEKQVPTEDIVHPLSGEFEDKTAGMVFKHFVQSRPGRIHVVMPSVENGNRQHLYEAALDKRLFKIWKPFSSSSNRAIPFHFLDQEKPIVLYSITFVDHPSFEKACLYTRNAGGKVYNVRGGDARVIAFAQRVQSDIFAHLASQGWDAAGENFAAALRQFG